jgi:hypothetical protein
MAIKTKPLEEVRESVPVHLVTRGDMVRVNILVPAQVRRAWKAAGLSVDKTVTDMLIEAMGEYLKRIK